MSFVVRPLARREAGETNAGRPPARFAWWLAGAASGLFAAWIAIDTLRTILPNISPLPWLDDWSTLDTFFSWKTGELTLFGALTKQVNEHRIVVPRLVFFLDDLVFGGQGRIAVVATLLVQALHAGFFLLILRRGRHSGRWVVGGIVVALMFSLRQSENFFSGFQLQFVAVFAAATVSFGLFAVCLNAERESRPIAIPLVGCLLAAAVSAFTMANGLLTAFVLVVLAVMARLRPSAVIICLVWAIVLVVVYYHGYQNIGRSNSVIVVLSHPLLLGGYVAAYLGSIGSNAPLPAAALGGVGILATVLVFARTAQAGPKSALNFALLGVMVFCGMTALLTAIGRDQYGVVQAVTSRYATPSAVFWAAQLTFWWSDPPRWPRSDIHRPVVTAAAAIFALAIAVEQPQSKPKLQDQAFRLNDATNLLALGLDDPDVVGRVAWDHDLVQWLLPLMRDNRLSIFDWPDVEAIGRPVADRGSMTVPNRCSGGISSIAADPSLGHDGLRVSGQGADGRRVIRRVLLVDGRDDVVGLASGLVPGGGRYDWSGYAVAPAAASLGAVAVLGDGTLCRLGSSPVRPTRTEH